jgi:peptidoglycan/xylan/chitin deacetylase (PgdA/CDA1 family)
MILIGLFILVVIVGLTYWLCMSSQSQLWGEFPYRKKTAKKVVAITFDDGPNEPYTSQIADYLNSMNVKATFFQVGSCVKRYPAVTKNLFQAGHTIANHSANHNFMDYIYHPRFKKEIQITQKIIFRTIGEYPSLFRPPWLWRTPFLFKTLKENKLVPISGKFCSFIEILQPNANTIARHALAKIKPGSIIIFHDGFSGEGGNRQKTFEAVKIVVEELKHRGYSMVTVDKLLQKAPYKKQ